MSTIRTFRDLIVWQRGMGLCKAIYRATVRMPKSELFGLTSQMRRAAVLIPSNIAEGYAKMTRPEYLRGLKIAAGSLAELSTQWEIAIELTMLPPQPRVMDLLKEQDRLLSALISKLERKQ
jgi:four helix bundle protein